MFTLVDTVGQATGSFIFKMCLFPSKSAFLKVLCEGIFHFTKTEINRFKKFWNGYLQLNSNRKLIGSNQT